MEQKVQPENPIMIGIDVEPEAVQISWFSNRLNEPETVGMQVGVDKFKIPFCLFYREEHKDYQIGQSAIDCNANQEKGVFVSSVYDCCVYKKTVKISNKGISAIKLMQIFLEKLIHLVEVITDSRKIISIAYTAEKMDKVLISILKEASEEFVKGGSKIYFKNYEESYIPYLLNGPLEYYTRDSVLFYFRKGCLNVYHIVVNKKFKPYTIMLQKEKIDGFEAVDEVLFCSDEDKKQLDAHFLETIKQLFGRALVSSVFLTGDGFDKEWMKESLRFLCQGRRVFQGKNLFTKGACYFLKEELTNNRKYKFDGDNRLLYKLEIPMWQDGNSKPYILAEGNGDWYEVNASFECLPDECDEIVVDIISCDEAEEKRRETLELTDMPNRPPLATRLQVNVTMTDVNELKISAKDLGLGEFYDATDKVWEKTIII